MRLFLLRHGDAEFGVGETKDIERKLSQKGKEQIQSVSIWLDKQMTEYPLRVYCSGAKRTRETCALLTKEISVGEISFHDEIYYATYKQLLEFVNQIPESVEEAILIGHNNAISDFASYILDKDIVFPTAGIVSIVFPIVDDWKSIGAGTGSEEVRYF